ncbi:MAG: sialidase family protein [Solirubrobacteraceae bacterium]|nr:sialidase family protein [Solirubrobacteraceae bacterium]
MALLALWLILGGVAAVILSGSFDEEPTVRLVGRDAPVNVSARSPDDLSAHNSPTLVRNPVRPANLAVSSRIDTPEFSCGLHVSADAGATWRQTPIPAPAGAQKCFAPDVAFSADGTLYLSFVTLAGPGNVPNALWLSKSTDGGQTLSTPLKVHGELTFQVRLATDPGNAKRIFLTWLQADEVGVLRISGTNSPIVAARSDDAGATWTDPAPVSGSARERVVTPAPVVGRDGSLYVLYQDLGEDRLDYEGVHRGQGGPAYDGRFSLVMARSRDGLGGWQESVVDTQIAPIGRFLVFLPPAPSVAIDDDGRLYAAFQDDRLGDPDVNLWTLEPGASKWNGPRRVNDTRRRDGTAQYLPRLAVAPDGRLDVLYYDRRADAENVMNHVSLQSSFDHGESFTSALRLSSQAFDSTIGFGRKEGLPDLGSRLALISSDRAALGVWTDTRAGTPATQKQDLAQGVISVSDPYRLPDAAETALRYGGFAAVLAGLILLGLVLRSRRRGARAATA